MRLRLGYRIRGTKIWAAVHLPHDLTVSENGVQKSAVSGYNIDCDNNRTYFPEYGNIGMEQVVPLATFCIVLSLIKLVAV